MDARFGSFVSTMGSQLNGTLSATRSQAPVDNSANETAAVGQPMATDGGAVGRIFSDTALVPKKFSDAGSCRRHIVAALESSARDGVVFDQRGDGVFYAGFTGQVDTYVIRCFTVGTGRYIFVSGSSADPDGLARGMQVIYGAI